MVRTAIVFLLLLTSIGFASQVDVKLNTAEPDAVLAILDKLSAKEAVTADDWQRLFATEGYIRLKQREDQMKRTFTDDDFQKFVKSTDLLERRQALTKTLAEWKRADVTAAANRALAYLPSNAKIRATVYPMIKPKINSFVFEANTNPAIFLYIDPALTKEQFENTMAHELHHIGYSSACPEDSVKRHETVQTVRQWIGAFGEGLAMLAAAGGPDVHPHQFSKAEDRARWDHDVANFDADLKTVEAFFNEILENKLTSEKIQDKAFSFFGIQGPWYTVGWKMAVTIEETFGRQKLIDTMCDPYLFLSTYNEAAVKQKQAMATWSPAFLSQIK